MARRHVRSNLRRPYRGPVTDINVAPFVDVMLVLVIIFMVAAPLLNIGVPVDLPKATLKPLNENQDPLVITVNSAGNTNSNNIDCMQDTSLIFDNSYIAGRLFRQFTIGLSRSGFALFSRIANPETRSWSKI